MIGFKAGCIWYEVGTASFLHSFFSTVAYHLESGAWGSRFPVLMNELYQGKLSLSSIPAAQKELDTIAAELAAFAPDKVVWDIEDLSAQPPWGTRISDRITSLANYYVTSDGQDFIGRLHEALDTARQLERDLLIS